MRVFLFEIDHVEIDYAVYTKRPIFFLELSEFQKRIFLHFDHSAYIDPRIRRCE